MRAATLLVGALLAAVPLQAQRPRNIEQQLRTARASLDSIRAERESLDRQLSSLRGRARDINSELTNLNRQRRSTGRIVNELDRQLARLTTQLDTLTLELILVQDALAEKRAVLERRVVEIHKRGPIWAFQVLLAAESFGDLLSRYKYLYLASQQDRALVGEIETLRRRLDRGREDLITVQTQVTTQRTDRGRELSRYARLERERQRILTQTRQREVLTAARLDRLARSDEELSDLITALERARRSGTRVLDAATISADDLGRLDWPVGGEVIYSPGIEEFRDGTMIPRQGIGIRVPVGTTVSAVRTGIVDFASTIGTYGQTVILNHGSGYYTLYAYLSRILVTRGEIVSEGQPIGLSGGVNTEEGPHLGFMIQLAPEGAEQPIQLDPRNWLKRR